MILPFLRMHIIMAILTEEQEDIREAIWQKHKTEENDIIREIEQARRVWNELQEKYKLFEARVTAEVNTALSPPVLSTVTKSTVDEVTVKIKVKCSLCKAEGHNKRSCKTLDKKN
jgi:Ribonuclease G/E